MSSGSARALLEASGYEVRFRTAEWVECLLSGDGESWVGHGVDRDTALAAALRLACPTPLARRLLHEALGRAIKKSGIAPELWPPWRGSSTPPPRASTSPPRISSSPGLPSVSVRPRTPTPLGRSVDRAKGQIAVIVSRPPPPRPSSGNFAVPALNTHGDVPRAETTEEALEELDILMDRVRDYREELGLCAPDRQRLAMLAWICLARSQTDAFPEDIRVRERVSAISRQLTEIGKTFWPGSVTALQLHMQPRDLPRHLLGGVATTWHRAAELAEQSLRNKEHEDERRGFDHYGWADGRQRIPRVASPRRALDELVAEVEALSGSLEVHASPADPSVRPETGVFLRWVRTLRWLRGAGVSPDRWARLAGRFRWWAFRREPALHQAARELEPGFVPPYPWAHHLGYGPDRQREVKEIRAVLGASPTLDDQASAAAWLARALEFADTHHGNILELSNAHRDLVLAVAPEDLNGSGDRLRVRLERLQVDLRDGKQTDGAPIPSADEVVEIATDDSPVALPSLLLDRVWPATEGKRSVFVSNRRDPELQARLQEAFAFKTLDCRIAESRRVQQLGEQIAGDKYDLVLGATGFQSHILDTVLAKACRQAGVQYIRVSHGRPLACLRAVARDLGR